MSSSSASDPANLPELPEGFVPGEHDVVIGKGKKFYFHTGNQWLRTLVASMLGEYKQAQTKSDKSNIISDVVEYVRTNGRFVKRDLKTGKWVYAEPLLCREKCSQTFRDNLAETYRSSNVAKRNKRRQEQEEKKRGNSPTSGLMTAAAPPQAKRMRTNHPASAFDAMNTTGAAATAHATTTDLNQAPPALQASSIPSNLFDLEMPLWSPKAQNPSVLSGNLDFSALVTRGSMTGATTTHSNNNGGFALNMQSAPSAAAAAIGASGAAAEPNNLSSLLSSFAQSLNANTGAANTATATTETILPSTTANLGLNPFEPTPLSSQPAMPPLTGTGAASTDLSASLANFDANAIFGALENVLAQAGPVVGAGAQQQQKQPKRHSLAPLGDDWFKFPAPPANSDEASQNISAAFAA